jgi:redox-sensitive bicupin YhaK (pirin superfamily)
MNNYRNVSRIVNGTETSDGAGVSLRRYIATPQLDMLDPFLLLDMFSSDDPDDYIAGFPPHPHRGFETVTYLLHGNMRHRDSTGREGVIRSGGVQWMTAGSGIEHSEIPEQEHGLLQGFQLWVNLPASQKMMAPRYQELEPEQMPVEKSAGMNIRVIAGETARGTRGPVTQIAAQPIYFDVTLNAENVFEQTLGEHHTAFVFVIDGELNIESDSNSQVIKNQLAILSHGTQLKIRAQQNSRFLLIAGQPFNEPVARYGPFVMNTREEIEQAFSDYRSGKFGHIA